MSFPRAKRFVESSMCAPSPADYNLKEKSVIGGAAIPKSARFVQQSPSASDNGSHFSVLSSPCFRTPTQIKKRKPIQSLSARKPPLKTLSFNSLDSEVEALKEKIVECNNKDLFIIDLTEQIEDMKQQLSALEKQKMQLNNDKLKYEERLFELKEEHKILIQNVYLEHDQEIHELKMRIHQESTELIKAHEELQCMKAQYDYEESQLTQEIDGLKLSHENEIKSLNKDIDHKNILIIEKEAELALLENKYKELDANYDSIINNLKQLHQTEITELEYQMLQSVTEMQTILDKEAQKYEKQIKTFKDSHLVEIEELKAGFMQEKDVIINETEAKIKQIEENSKEANVLAEIQMLEKFNDSELSWKLKFENQETESNAILKECQAISEYNIIQCEHEKQDINKLLTEKLNLLEILESEKAGLATICKGLQTKVDELQNELRTALDALTHSLNVEQLESCKAELQNALKQKKMYEKSIAKIHETVEALKKRLLNSDRDVEQLKSELETCELSKLEFEGKCNQLIEELQVVSKLNEDLLLTEETCNKIKVDLLQKVDLYKLKAQEEIDALTTKLALKENQLVDVLNDLHESQLINSQAQALIETARMEIDRLESQNLGMEYKINCFEASCDKLQIDLVEANKSIKIIREEHKECKTILDAKTKLILELHEKIAKLADNNQVDSLMKQITVLQSKSDDYFQYCDYYKSKVTEYEKEIDDLVGVNKKYIEQSGKYDNLLQKFEAMEIKNRDLERKINEQEILIGPFREQLEAYELEHSALINQKSEAEMEAKNMGLKYAQLLGHQNQKQKIKHMIDLKNKNSELIESKRDMELKVKSQTRMIEKLKNELANITKSPRKSKLHSNDKENINSPNRTNLNTSRVESPGLRERN